jgi:hypothetical protein
VQFGLLCDFRNPKRWERPVTELYAELLDQIAYAEELGDDSVWLTEHHFVEDGYTPSLLTLAAAIAARMTRIRNDTPDASRRSPTLGQAMTRAAKAVKVVDGIFVLGPGTGRPVWNAMRCTHEGGTEGWTGPSRPTAPPGRSPAGPAA